MKKSYCNTKNELQILLITLKRPPWSLHIRIKIDILNERLKWYKKLSFFFKWAIQNNSDALAA